MPPDSPEKNRAFHAPDGDRAYITAAYGTALRLYRPLLEAAVITLAPGPLATLGVILAIGDRAVIVNGAPSVAPGSFWVGAAFAGTGLITVLGVLVGLVACCRVVLEAFRGRSLCGGQAVAEVLRQPGPLVLLVLQGVAVCAAVATGVGLWILSGIGTMVPVLIILVGLVFMMFPLILALPALADRRPPVRTARALARIAYGDTLVNLGLGVMVLPSAIPLALWGLGRVLPVGSALPAIDGLCLAATVMAVPFQAATLAVFYQARRTSRPAPVPPASACGPAVAVLAALVALPGATYGTALIANPTHLVEVADVELPHMSSQDGEMPEKTHLLFGPDGHPIVVRDSFRPELAFCADAACSDTAVVTVKDFIEVNSGYVAMPDGSVTVAGWVLDQEALRLTLFSCRPEGCRRVSGAALRVASKDAAYAVHTAIARTPHGLAVASLAEDPSSRGKGLLQLTLCGDPRCSASTTTAVATAESDTYRVTLDNRMLDIAVSPDGSPVMAFASRESDVVTLVLCESAECTAPAVRTFDRRLPSSRVTPWRQSSMRTHLMVRPDGRPVVVHSDTSDDDQVVTRMISCTSRTCEGPPRFEEIRELVALGVPGMAMDARGRPMLAGYDRVSGRLAVLRCEDDHCARRRMRLLQDTEGVNTVEFAIGPDDRSRLIWYGANRSADDFAHHLLTCLTPRCGA
ncbi:ABC transporter permease [Sinosporangium album]|uniref:ABC transporter permease n=1 Tax=Sinosporangium album TaxID=504805 RepID=UPI00115FEC73|nr:ABC transporter permease [Sinosporangium album]